MIAAALVLVALLGAAATVFSCAAVAGAVDAVLDADEPQEPLETDIDRTIRWLTAEGQLLLDAERRRTR